MRQGKIGGWRRGNRSEKGVEVGKEGGKEEDGGVGGKEEGEEGGGKAEPNAIVKIMAGHSKTPPTPFKSTGGGRCAAWLVAGRSKALLDFGTYSLVQVEGVYLLGGGRGGGPVVVCHLLRYLGCFDFRSSS